jgi:hypothetical protein
MDGVLVKLSGCQVSFRVQKKCYGIVIVLQVSARPLRCAHYSGSDKLSSK